MREACTAAFAKFFACHNVTLVRFGNAAAAAGLTDSEARQVSASLWASWTHHERVIASIDELTEGGRQQFEGTWRFALSPAGPSGGWYWSMRSRLNPTAVKYVDELPARSA